MTRKPVFMVVDDDEDDRDLLSLVCREGSYPCDILFAQSGSDALQVLEDSEVKPSVMLLDVNMPGMNGLELLHQLKSSTKWKGIPVVMLTTASSPQLIQDAYRLGANSYLVKPDSFRSLLKIWDSLYRFWCTTASLPVPIA